MRKSIKRVFEEGQQDIEHPLNRGPQRIAVSKEGMVATQHYLATEAGVDMLKQGGNAIDAAVAAGFALGVCEPAASGLGGQTMMLIHLSKKRRTFALDGSSRAPNRTLLEKLSESDRTRGYKATTVPSTPAALNYVLMKYGRLSLSQVIQPSIRLAEEGFVVTELLHSLSRQVTEHFHNSTAGEIFLKDQKRIYRVGELLRQPVLAGTLRRLADFGIRDFYRGAIAGLIHQDMIQNGGLIREDDLAQIPRPIERRPITCNFGSLRIFTFPPPGAGRTLIELLNIMEQLPSKDL